jgi:hypothetical protein
LANLNVQPKFQELFTASNQESTSSNNISDIVCVIKFTYIWNKVNTVSKSPKRKERKKKRKNEDGKKLFLKRRDCGAVGGGKK